MDITLANIIFSYIFVETNYVLLGHTQI